MELKMSYGQLSARAPGVNTLVSFTLAMYAARILADSIANGVRLVTMEVTFPRFILAEFNTHRMLSRNSASSRAIPVHKRISQVWRHPFVPEAFGLNKSGMQSSANLGGWRAFLVRRLWLLASKFCCIIAWCMSKMDAHKQHANRVLEPWAWHTVVVSATEWENFFRLRTHKAAQPEMQIIAKLMRDAFEKSTPRTLSPGEWHLPYVKPLETRVGYAQEVLVQSSVVRSAAVSYERQDAERSHEQIAKRHDEMLVSAHWSPFEHAAKVATEEELRRHAMYLWTDYGDEEIGGFIPAYIGNFRAPWLQYRKTFEGEDVWRGGN